MRVGTVQLSLGIGWILLGSFKGRWRRSNAYQAAVDGGVPVGMPAPTVR